MAVESLVLAANPGSASRKYALYSGSKLKASLHYEFEDGKVICTLESSQGPQKIDPNLASLEEAPGHIMRLLTEKRLIGRGKLLCIGLRVVAPTGYFLQDRIFDDEAMEKLRQLETKVPLHIRSTLHEATYFKDNYPEIPVVLVSDSAFHKSKPDYAWNYAIHLEDADRLEIKRFGYHGISVSSVVNALSRENKILDKMIICHLGSGSSITAVLNGKSVENSMGYSPLEGMMMATRSGPLDVVAALTLKAALGLDDEAFESYLNQSSGLSGISGESSDIRELLKYEASGDYRAGLALRMFVYRAQQVIGQMAAVLDGVDGLVFTGTVGVRSSEIRKRILEKLGFLNLVADERLNNSVFEPSKIEKIHLRTRNKPIYVITTDEASEIAARARDIIKGV